jgi:hypothetical protein
MSFSLAAQPGCQSLRDLIHKLLKDINGAAMCGFDARDVRIWQSGGPEKFIEGKAALVEKFSRD